MAKIKEGLFKLNKLTNLTQFCKVGISKSLYFGGDEAALDARDVLMALPIFMRNVRN